MIHRDKVEHYRWEKAGRGKGVKEHASRRESAISRTLLSSSCGQISDERSADMVGLNKHRNQTVVTHAGGLVLTRDVSH